MTSKAAINREIDAALEVHQRRYQESLVAGIPTADGFGCSITCGKCGGTSAFSSWRYDGPHKGTWPVLRYDIWQCPRCKTTTERQAYVSNGRQSCRVILVLDLWRDPGKFEGRQFPQTAVQDPASNTGAGI